MANIGFNPGESAKKGNAPRPIRFCPLCKIADDHPRHAVDDGGDPNVSPHMDCCRDAGCPDGTCDILTKGAEGLAGKDFLDHLIGLDMQKAANDLAAYQAEYMPDLNETFRRTDPSVVIDMQGAE